MSTAEVALHRLYSVTAAAKQGSVVAAAVCLKNKGVALGPKIICSTSKMYSAPDVGPEGAGTGVVNAGVAGAGGPADE